MIVSELIAELQRMPGDAQVKMAGTREGGSETTSWDDDIWSDLQAVQDLGTRVVLEPDQSSTEYR